MQKFALEEPNQTVEIQTTELQVAKNDLHQNGSEVANVFQVRINS
jgi:uncharacterized protein HemY